MEVSEPSDQKQSALIRSSRPRSGTKHGPFDRIPRSRSHARRVMRSSNRSRSPRDQRPTARLPPPWSRATAAPPTAVMVLGWSSPITHGRALIPNYNHPTLCQGEDGQKGALITSVWSTGDAVRATARPRGKLQLRRGIPEPLGHHRVRGHHTTTQEGF
jgi:hypothetical protein